MNRKPHIAIRCISTFMSPLVWVISNVLLLLIYILVITPQGILSRISGRRSRMISPDPDAKTYWRPVSSEKTIENYYRKF